MLKFEPFSIAALKRALPYIKKSTSLCSEFSAGSLFMWQEGTNLHFCVWNDTFAIRQNIGEQPAFTWPVGADVSGMVDKLYKYAKDNHIALRFYEVDDNTLQIIKSDKRFGSVMYAYEDRWSDYIYSFSDVISFKGNKYKGQRNHINKFKRLYGEPQIRFICNNDFENIKAMLAEYSHAHNDANSLEITELQKTEELLDVYNELGLYAACLTVNDEIAALSIGEVVGDTLLIHIEKSLTRYEGIYPTMYQGFVKLICKREGRVLRLVNREDDSGDEGLRISKMQYHPIGRVNKHLVHIDSPASKLNKIPVIITDGVVLTQFEEKDKPVYLELNTDTENNRFWGYDYREDEYILGDIDQNTFYDFTMLDMQSGDSINFAVRTSVDGDMIGEAILWNFSADGYAEVGCRLLPSFQGKGLGKAAFNALADFAQNSLNLKPIARCYIENIKSYNMICKSGFFECAKDKAYFYFNRNSGF